jgi:hypothetical protein
MNGPTAIYPPFGSALGIHSLTREMQEMAAFTLNPPPFPTDRFEHGNGRPVLALPGFLAGDWTTIRLREFLRGLGYRVETAEVFFNMGPTRGLIAKLQSKLDALADETYAPVSLIGVSLGGLLARQLARSNRRRVAGVVTLCSPVRFPVTTPLQPFALALAPLHEATWTAQRDEIWRPIGLPVTALYSEDDGIVDWRQCLIEEDDLSENIEIGGAHMTVCSNPRAQATIASALGRFSARFAMQPGPEGLLRPAGAAPDS